MVKQWHRRGVGTFLPLVCHVGGKKGAQVIPAWENTDKNITGKFWLPRGLGPSDGLVNDYRPRGPLFPYPNWILIFRSFDLAPSSLIQPLKWPNLQLPCAHGLQEPDPPFGEFCDGLSSCCHGPMGSRQSTRWTRPSPSRSTPDGPGAVKMACSRTPPPPCWNRAMASCGSARRLASSASMEQPSNITPASMSSDSPTTTSSA